MPVQVSMTRGSAWLFSTTPQPGWKLTPTCGKSVSEAAAALERFQGARQEIKVMITDNVPVLVKTIILLNTGQDTSAA
eukprot:14785535-Heterocapsa_arctica.AAC.1